MAAMDSKTRYNIRLSERKGVTVREGTDGDLSTFYRLLLDTGARQEFTTYDEQYYSTVWHLYAPRGYARVFLAEYRGEPVSALFAIAFGDTVTYWRGAWSGRHGNVHPNEALHWAAIRWAGENRYKYYDFEGIDPEVAHAVVRGEPLSAGTQRSVATFKLGFGGEVVFWPGVYDWVPNPVLRRAYSVVAPRLATGGMVTRAIEMLRGVRGSRKAA
jgi:lipid II:glycine glycyltransferase (peptidoglycan interpeptide bridge formation enzyme)